MKQTHSINFCNSTPHEETQIEILLSFMAILQKKWEDNYGSEYRIMICINLLMSDKTAAI